MDGFLQLALAVCLGSIAIAALAGAHYLWRRASLLRAPIPVDGKSAAVEDAPAPAPVALVPEPVDVVDEEASPQASAPEPPAPTAGRLNLAAVPDSTVMHVRTHIDRLLGSLSLIASAATRDGDTRMMLETVGDEATRLGRMINELLAFSRRREARPRSMNLQPLIEAVVGKCLSTGEARPPISLSLDVNCGGPVRVDSELIEEALTHLVRNALEAMPRGGELRISAATGIDEGTAGVILRVEDTGMGLGDDAAAPECLFDPFVTTHSDASGIGLAVVRLVAEAHGGRARIAARQPRGVVVSLFLPGAQATSATA